MEGLERTHPTSLTRPCGIEGCIALGLRPMNVGGQSLRELHSRPQAGARQRGRNGS
jgi:hypothetical protein